MSGELDLIRAFRAEDAVVDASSQENARAALLEHIDRSTTSTRRRRWGWLRRRSRPMAVLLVALVIAGAGGAAVLSLSSSQPLAGRVPGAITPVSMAGYRYTITVIPGLAATGGNGGWQSFIVYRRGGITSHEFSVVAGYPTATKPIFTFSGFGDSNGAVDANALAERRFARGKTVAYVLTGPQVWAVRIGSRTIRTVGSRDLPAGDRAAVFFIPAKGAVPLPGWRPGLPIRGYLRGTQHVPFVAILPLDRSGQVIATQFTMPGPGPPLLTWMAPKAVTRWWPLPGFTVPYHHPGYHGRTRPGPGVCELAQQGLPALHAEFGHTIAWISPDPHALGQVFMSCIDTEYYLNGWPLQAGVLLDGHRPGQVLGPIPGAQPVPGQPDMVNLPAGRVPWNYGSPVTADSPDFSLTARRVGNAWLVVQGGSGLAQRVQVLNSLRISKLDLHHLGP